MFKKIIDAFKNKDIRQRIFFTLGILLIYKLGTTIPVPRVDLGGLDFSKNENVLTKSEIKDGRRIYSFEKEFFHMVTLGNNSVITADEVLHPFLKDGLFAYQRLFH